MKIKVQLVLCAEDGREEEVHEIAVVEKPHQRIEHLGLTLAEAKSILKTLQQHLVERQATAFVAARAQRADCGQPLGIKEHHTRTFRTLFGTVTLTSPRLYHCWCQRRKTTTFRPLNALLTDAVAPELLFMETKWASLVSYGLTAQALKDFLPMDTTLNATTIQNHTLKVAERCEAELGEEQWSFVDGCPRDWGNLPIPDGPAHGRYRWRLCAGLGRKETAVRGDCRQEHAGLQTRRHGGYPVWQVLWIRADLRHEAQTVAL